MSKNLDDSKLLREWLESNYDDNGLDYLSNITAYIAELEARVEPLQPFKLKILELEATIEEAKNRCNTLINEDARHADNIIWIKEALGDKV